MRTHDYLRQGGSIPRGSWRGIDPRTKVVPAKKGKAAPYRRQPRRKGEDSRVEESSPLSERGCDFFSAMIPIFLAHTDISILAIRHGNTFSPYPLR
jgi:hypothetical protein